MRTGLRRQKTGQGFTLLEVLLATVLLMLLLGAIVFNYSTLQRGAALEEGGTQFEALLRYAQAYAAESGRKVQLVFEEEVAEDITVALGRVRLMWEPDPLTQPGIMAEVPAAADLLRSIRELVQVESVRLFEPGDSPGVENTPATNQVETADSDEALFEYQPPITFYPDGSSDSAEIRLASLDPEDTRRAVVRLSGITGTIQRRRVAEETEPAETPGEKKEPVKGTTVETPAGTTPAPPDNSGPP